MSYAYTAPQVILDLLAAFTAALPGVDVLDGPVVSGASLPEAITVGYQDAVAGIAAVDAQTAREQYTLDPTREQYTINCSIAVIASTSATVEARFRCFDLLRSVNDVLVDFATFTVSVMSAQVGAYTLTQEPASNGVVVRLAFGVDIDAFTKETTG